MDFDEQNIHAQCSHCNKWLHGNLAVYATGLVRQYGPNILDELEQRKSKIYTLEELLEKETYYEQAIKQLSQ